MRNREAARYARWAAIMAAAITLLVAGVYIQRDVRRSRARHAEPAAIPEAVQQQSSQFHYRGGDKARTILEIRASRATRFKGGQNALLEDVVINVRGRDRGIDDTIETHECSYDQGSGAVRCAGEVRMQLRGTASRKPPAPEAAGAPLGLEMSDLSFNEKTGDASTPSPVQFTFAQGRGHGVGLSYSTRDSTLRVEHAVEFDLVASERLGGVPIVATGSSLEIQRDARTVELAGPASVRQGDRELEAQNILIHLDETFHAREITAEGRPEIRSSERGAPLALSANKLHASLGPEGWLQTIIADGDVAGTRLAASGAQQRFAAQHLEIAMQPRENVAREMTATGNVSARSDQPGASQILKTEALRVTFAPAPPGASARPKRAAASAPRGIEIQQQIQTAETLAPASIESTRAGQTTRIRANRFVAPFSAAGQIEKLFGHGDVETSRQTGKGVALTSVAPELSASFTKDGQVAALEETGGVRIEDADRVATSARLTFDQSSGMVTLDGSPVLTDTDSRSTVGDRVTIKIVNQKPDEIQATGGVVSTYLASTRPAPPSKSALGAAHISANTLSGSASSGHLVYAGHARLWQGEYVMDADRIELWRDEKKLQAAGNVAAVFPQAAGPLSDLSTIGAKPARASATEAPRQSAANSGQHPSGPSVWQVRAPLLTYWSDQARVRLEGGVTATSQENSLESRTLDVYLAPSHSSVPPAAAAPLSLKPAPEASIEDVGAQQLSRLVAQGAVVVRQGDRHGSADRAEYTAADRKFVLSGGKPTLADADGNTVTGHSLTFFLTGDTILIDSQEGSRTLTKLRVEK